MRDANAFAYIAIMFVGTAEHPMNEDRKKTRCEPVRLANDVCDGGAVVRIYCKMCILYIQYFIVTQ